jgi:4-carboxymuconolactone decarboxylase
LVGAAFQLTVASMAAADSELAQYLVADAYGKVLSRAGLSLEDRELCIIAALACRAHLPQLKWHMAAALNIGVIPEAIREVLVQSQPYAGWPTCLNALSAMTAVFAEQGRTLTAEPAPRLERSELRERGLANGGKIYPDYAAVEAVVAGYDSELADYLTENASGQIYARGKISVQQRELVAIAMLTAQQQLTQLAWHLRGAHRVGCTHAQTKEVIVTMPLYVGWPSTLNALAIWQQETRGPEASAPTSSSE